jgi:hypothetical protein
MERGEVMALDVTMTPHDAFLEVVVTGTYDMQDAVDRFLHTLSACRLPGLCKVLIDFRDLTGLPAATERIMYAYEIQDQYYQHLSTGGQELMVAYVGIEPHVGGWDPGLEVAQESDMPFDTFTDIEEAYEWLGERPT